MNSTALSHARGCFKGSECTGLRPAGSRGRSLRSSGRRCIARWPRRGSSMPWRCTSRASGPGRHRPRARSWLCGSPRSIRRNTMRWRCCCCTPGPWRGAVEGWCRGDVPPDAPAQLADEGEERGWREVLKAVGTSGEDGRRVLRAWGLELGGNGDLKDLTHMMVQETDQACWAHKGVETGSEVMPAGEYSRPPGSVLEPPAEGRHAPWTSRSMRRRPSRRSSSWTKPAS